MTTVNVTGAAQRLLSMGTNTPGECLAFCDKALLQGLPSTGPGPHPIPTAFAAWQYTTKRHADTNVPRDFPIFLGESATRTDADKNAGDVMISLGGGIYACTDAPGLGAGRIGTCSLAQRIAQTQRPVLGWVEGFAGYDLTATSFSSVGTPVPVVTPVPEEDDMGFYIQSSSAGPKYWFNQSTGKARAVSSAEWNFLRAQQGQSAANNPQPIQLVTVSAGWLTNALAL